MNKNYKKIGLFLGLIVVLIIISNTAMQLTQASPDIQPGDLIFMDHIPDVVINDITKNIKSNDHVALYIGNGMCFSAGYTVSGKGVDYVPLTYYTTNPAMFRNLTIGRVLGATQTQRNNAINWVKAHKWDLYQYWYYNEGGSPQKCENPNCTIFGHKKTRDQWYCSELVWAAYYNQGIDIDNNGWGLPPWMVSCVSMGAPVKHEDWMHVFMTNPYAYQNEIKLDTNIQLIPWT